MRRALVLGANGRLGRCLIEAFVRAGWDAVGQVRRPSDSVLPHKQIQLPVDQTEALLQAAGSVDVVVHALNPPYTRWQQDAMPLTDAAIAIARAANARLLFPGNVYNFGAGMPGSLLESTPARPTSRKGALRVALEERLREAARGGSNVAILRAGDFFGGPGRGSWFDLVIAKSLAQGKVVYPGRLDVVHAWAYLPDLAAAFVRLAACDRAALAPFEVLHFPGHTLTGVQLVAHLQSAARALGVVASQATLRLSNLPWGFMRVGGMFVPMWRELSELRYLWDVPHALAGDRLQKLIGDVPHTPAAQAVEQALKASMPSRAQ